MAERGVIAIDPGLATGFAVISDGHDFLSTEIVGTLEFLDAFVALIDSTVEREWEVICEAFIVTDSTTKKTRQNYSLEIIGAVRFLCHQRMIPFELQTPAQAKTFSTDSKLRKLGWYRPAKGHANDAARHLCLYLIRHNRLDPGSLLE